MVLIFSAIIVGLFFLRPPLAFLNAILCVIAGVWVVAGAILAVRFFQKPTSKQLAMRADQVLGLPDDLLALSEFPESAKEWQVAAWNQTLRALKDGRRTWPLGFSRRHLLYSLAALLLTVVASGKALELRNAEIRIEAIAEQARTERVEAAEEVIKDWEEFAKTTDDPELKKLFSEAVELREALQNPDPMAAMLAVNDLEAKMTSLSETLEADSMAP